MKNYFLMVVLFSTLSLHAQNIGIGTTTPTEKLEINGGIKIGATSNTAEGTIRWSVFNKDFEGYNGSNWVSLTGGKGTWGNQYNYATPNGASDISLHPNSSFTDWGDFLGESIAMDGNITVVGARGDYSSDRQYNYSGNAYLSIKTSDGWIYKRIIENPTPGGGDGFGISAGIHNNTIIIGAFNAGVSGTNKGEAYIYQYDSASNTLSAPVTLTANDGATGDSYGESTAIYGDYAIVGAPNKDIAGFDNCGAAYIYKRNGNNWSHISFISPAERNTTDGFGKKVSISGNWAAVSAIGAAANGTIYAGKVYLYQANANGTAFIYHSTLYSPNPLIYGQYGYGLFLSGDTLVVGEPRRNAITTTDDPGKLYVYIRNGNNWNLQATLMTSDGKKGDAFGHSVHFKNNQLIAGAPYANVYGGLSQGKAYVFQLNNNMWQQQAILTSGRTELYDQFGWAVAIQDNDIVVSSRTEDLPNKPDHGRLYYFKR